MATRSSPSVRTPRWSRPARSQQPPPSAQATSRIEEEVDTPTASSPAPTSTNALVTYTPATPRDTRSQVERRSRADAGDVHAGLELISPDAAADALSRRYCRHQPDRSILSFLQDPGAGMTSREAAAIVLEDLADRTQETALDCLQVVRYVQFYELWKGHPDPLVRSAEAFIRTLDAGKYILANLAIATSTQLERRGRIRIIDKAWGVDWFQRIPPSLRQPSWTRPEDCSTAILSQIAANAKQSITLDQAIERWVAAIDTRTDEGARRRLGIKGSTARHLLPSDIASLNRNRKDEDKGRRTADVFFPDVQDNQLRVELVPATTASSSSRRPNYTTGGAPRKRARVAAEDTGNDGDTESGDGEGWVVAADGRTESKRVRNHVVRRPISPSRFIEPAPSVTSPPRTETCDGAAIALMLRKLVHTFEAWDNCCEHCRPHMRNVTSILRSQVAPFASALENVQSHVFGGAEIPVSQHDDISPLKPDPPRKRRSHLFVDDSDDD